MNLTQRRNLLRRLEAQYVKSLDLLVELAGSYRAHHGQVPTEVADALGVAQNRHRELQQFAKVWLQYTDSPGTTALAKSFHKETLEHTKTIQALLERLRLTSEAVHVQQ